jgi:tripartite-type tricarboxylate transporter receptor subunit TctC
MKLRRRQFVHLAAGVVAAFSGMLFSGHAAWSQTTSKIVVPVQPGGTATILARLLAEQIANAHGPTMVIENRPGAGSIIATEAAARAAPDGGTLLMTLPGFLTNPHLRKVNYDPLSRQGER